MDKEKFQLKEEVEKKTINFSHNFFNWAQFTASGFVPSTPYTIENSLTLCEHWITTTTTTPINLNQFCLFCPFAFIFCCCFIFRSTFSHATAIQSLFSLHASHSDPVCDIFKFNSQPNSTCCAMAWVCECLQLPFWLFV